MPQRSNLNVPIPTAIEQAVRNLNSLNDDSSYELKGWAETLYSDILTMRCKMVFTTASGMRKEITERFALITTFNGDLIEYVPINRREKGRVIHMRREMRFQ